MATHESEAKEFFINLELETTERFDMSRFMRFDCDVFDPIAAHMISQVKALDSGGNYTAEGEDFRPDLVSNKIYGTTEYWWIILLYNDKLSFQDLQHGDELEYPSVQAIEDLYFRLKINQNAIDRE